jgi:hypothetical protein
MNPDTRNKKVHLCISLFFITVISIQFSNSLLLSIIHRANYYYYQYQLEYSNNFTELKMPIQEWERSNKKEIVINGNYYDIKNLKDKSADSVTLNAKLDEFDNLISFFKKEISSEKNNNTSKSNENRIKIYFPVWCDLPEDNSKMHSSGIHLFWENTPEIPEGFFLKIFNPPKV